MPDIAMCGGVRDGKSCPRLHECYRHEATPSEFRQAYFGAAPFLDDGTCGDFVPVRQLTRRGEGE